MKKERPYDFVIKKEDFDNEHNVNYQAFISSLTDIIALYIRNKEIDNHFIEE